MRSKRHLHSFLILTIFAMIVLLSAICVLAESGVRITQPENGSTIKPGEVAVCATFAQPPNMPAGLIITHDGDAEYIESMYGFKYTPVRLRILKDGVLWNERDINPRYLNFDPEGSEVCSFLFEEEGTYTISARVADNRKSDWDSVTVNVRGEYDGIDYSGGSIDSSNAAVMTEGSAVRCTLTPANNFMYAFKVKPASSGKYVFYSSGYKKQILCELYEGTGDTSDLDRIDYEENEEGNIGLSAELDAGTTYTFVIKGYVKKTNTVFDVGFVSKDSGKIMSTASEVTLTDKVSNYSLAAFSGIEIPESEWIISDKSVVNWDGCGNGTSSRGGELLFSHYNISLQATGNGTATVKLIDKSTKAVYANCMVTCKNIPESADESGSSQPGGEAGNNSGSGDAASVAKTVSVTPAVTLSSKKFKWNNKVHKPAVTVKVKGKKLSKSQYSVKYKGGCKAIGTYKVTVTLKGKYKGSKTVSFTIVPKGTSLKSVTGAKKALKVKWKKQTARMPKKQITGYQVQYSTSKNFKTKAKIRTIKGVKKSSIRISKLKSKKTYYMRVRTYRKTGGKTYYSGWSKAKHCKTK